MECIEWTANLEGQLLEAMVGHKPVGINRFFEMAFICDKFASELEREISSDTIWSHLKTMYNLDYLNECESTPFPNAEVEFTLPEDFSALMAIRDDAKKTVTPKMKETPKSSRESVNRKEEKAPAVKVNAKSSTPQRETTESPDMMRTPTTRKERKRDSEKVQWKIKNTLRGEANSTEKKKLEESNKQPATKRSTRGSMKPDESNTNKTVSPVPVKRRRIS